MRKNYQYIIDVVLGVLFVMLVYGLAKSIVFLDYSMGYYGANQAFADTLIHNDILLLAFSVVSIFLCLLYPLTDLKPLRYSSLFRFLIGICLMGIAAYMFIILVSLREQAFSIDDYATKNAFSLYLEYRNFSLMTCFSQFLLALAALVRSLLDFIHRNKEENPVEKD